MCFYASVCVCGRNANNGRNQRSKYRNIKVHVSKNVIESKLLSAFVKGHAFHTLGFRELYIGSDMSFKLSTLFNRVCVILQLNQSIMIMLIGKLCDDYSIN